MSHIIRANMTQEIKKHQEQIELWNEQMEKYHTGNTILAMAKMMDAFNGSNDPKFKETEALGERRHQDIENHLQFHKLMLLLFRTFDAVFKGKSEVRVLPLIADKVKEAIHNLLEGIEALVPYGSDFYSEEEYRKISNNLMEEYNNWAHLCNMKKGRITLSRNQAYRQSS